MELTREEIYGSRSGPHRTGLHCKCVKPAPVIEKLARSSSPTPLLSIFTVCAATIDAKMRLYRLCTVIVFYQILTYIPKTLAVPIGATEPQFLPEMEIAMAKIIRNYVELERGKLDQLEQQATLLEQRSNTHNATEQNPIWLYRTVEVLMEEWNELHATMNATFLQTILASNPPTPEFLHLMEIAMAIFRIQDVYTFNAADVASGRVKGLDISGNLTARDCFNLGVIAHSKDDFYHALLWFDEANSRISQEEKQTMEPKEIWPMLAISLEKKGNKERAEKLVLEYEKESESGRVEEMSAMFPVFHTLLENAKNNDKLSSIELAPTKNERLDWYDTTEQPRYEALCRQEYKKKFNSSSSNYTCHYVKNTPYLMLAPAKLERMYEDPPVAIYRQMISDQEIAIIKSVAKAKLDRSRVSERNAGGIVLNSARESYTGWLRDDEHPVVERVRRRVGLFTGLTMESAEDLQVTEYGIGGHYGPHYDHATKEARSKPDYTGSWNADTGDRIATLMFYLVEPEHGGGTAFPFANLVVKPTKNDAIFWYNLRRSGAGDYNTLHAGCPVVSGSKWVANEWIKERGQEFRRLCTLSEYD